MYVPVTSLYIPQENVPVGQTYSNWFRFFKGLEYLGTHNFTKILDLLILVWIAFHRGQNGTFHPSSSLNRRDICLFFPVSQAQSRYLAP